MFPIGLLFSATLFEEISETIGKTSVKRRREDVFCLAFLGLFWSVIFLIASVFLFGAKFIIVQASLPTLMLRIMGEILLTYVLSEAIIRADRSTLGFLRLLSIPILLGFDVALGYHLTTLQVVAVFALLAGMALAFRRNPAGRRGAGWALAVAIIAAVCSTLFKWDISHYNSVAGEQIAVYSTVLGFYYVQARLAGNNPLKLLVKRASGIQSLSNGFGLAIESFAYAYAPVSVMVAVKRSFAIFWAVIFGQRFFHERRTHHKIIAGAVLAVGLILMVSPYL
jgi:hypothetical protein